MRLSEARQQFPFGTLFLSATNNIKKPLSVLRLRYALHEDRINRIKFLEKFILNLHNTENYPTFVNKFSKLDLEKCSAKKEIEERNYLLSLKKDIVNETGGVIFCGETNTIAKKC